MTRRKMRCAALALLAGAATQFANQAWAAEPKEADLTHARDLYRAAMALEVAGDWASALAKMQQVAAVKSTPQVRFHLGRCQEKLGKWTEAIGSYRMAVSEAESMHAADVVREADEAGKALEARIPKLTVSRAESATGATISIDGIDVGAPSIGTAQRIDPGSHKVEATLPGKPRFVANVELAPNESRNVTVQFESGSISAAPPPNALPAGDTTPRSGSLALPIVLFGTGAAAGVVGGVFWSLRQDTLSTLGGACTGTHCPSNLASVGSRGELDTTVAIASFAAAGAAVSIGAIVLVRSRSGSTVSARPGSAASPLGGRLEGSF